MPAESLSSLPIARLSAIAASADPQEAAAYELKSKDLALAGTLFNSAAPDFTQLAAAAGLSSSDLSRVISDPARVAAIVAHSEKSAALGRSAVYARILNMALTSRSASWAKLFLERFDEVYRKQKVLENATLNQTNYVSSMSDTELHAFLKLTSKATLGSAE